MLSGLISALLVFSPAIFWGILFAWSYRREPRQFKNAIFFFLMLIFALSACAVYTQDIGIFVLLGIAIPFAPIVTVVFLLVNAWIVIRREGFSLSNILPGLFALVIVGWIIGIPVAIGMSDSKVVLSLSALLLVLGLWFFFSFVALLVYSWFYRRLPRKRRFDYIIIHGAGLRGEEPTPLLRGRIDKAVELWKAQGSHAILVPSGGQGSDEVISEAEAMSRYLSARGVPQDSILLEDRSTTTMENLVFAKNLLDARQTTPYRCAFVTSDYHVFRTALYASKVGLKGDGIGSKTAGYYFPTAFIREFIAITKEHWLPYVIITMIWAASVLAPYLGHLLGILFPNQ
ncbi:YdcF family protein [uncultured Actinomyces sp.]|uniref:YdcF family protein n=1 Tax=uncultured Actinomyces sp. TaxID=249061 RepID=UPI0028EE4803|nr:YdcF family protein [uncultured Actinomyces sp.]